MPITRQFSAEACQRFPDAVECRGNSAGQAMGTTTPGSTAQVQAALAEGSSSSAADRASRRASGPNPGWSALPGGDADWRVVPPRSPLAKLWAGDGTRDDWHMLAALLLSGLAFVWVSEKLYRGRSKPTTPLSQWRRAGLLCVACFYLTHNVVIVVSSLGFSSALLSTCLFSLFFDSARDSSLRAFFLVVAAAAVCLWAGGCFSRSFSVSAHFVMFACVCAAAAAT